MSPYSYQGSSPHHQARPGQWASSAYPDHRPPPYSAHAGGHQYGNMSPAWHASSGYHGQTPYQHDAYDNYGGAVQRYGLDPYDDGYLYSSPPRRLNQGRGWGRDLPARRQGLYALDDSDLYGRGARLASGLRGGAGLDLDRGLGRGLSRRGDALLEYDLLALEEQERARRRLRRAQAYNGFTRYPASRARRLGRDQPDSYVCVVM